MSRFISWEFPYQDTIEYLKTDHISESCVRSNFSGHILERSSNWMDFRMRNSIWSQQKVSQFYLAIIRLICNLFLRQSFMIHNRNEVLSGWVLGWLNLLISLETFSFFDKFYRKGMKITACNLKIQFLTICGSCFFGTTLLLWQLRKMLEKSEEMEFQGKGSSAASVDDAVEASFL